jgi:hypothetical protein
LKITTFKEPTNALECMNAMLGFWWRNLSERDHWGDPSVDGKIILRWIFKK